MFDPFRHPFEPQSAEEEGYALMAALSGARAASGALGFLGLAVSGLVLLALVVEGPGDPAVAAGIALFVVLWSVGPALLAASAFQGARGSDGIAGYVRQARLLTAFWWVAGITGLSFLVLNAIALVVGLLLSR